MNAGFTLIETLVAFVILSLVTITGFTLLGDGFRAIGRVEARQEMQDRATGLLNVMAQGGDPQSVPREGLQLVEQPVGTRTSTGFQPMRIRISADGVLLADSIILRRVPP